MNLIEIETIDKIKQKMILAKIISTKGSSPRDENTYMIISKSKFFGTIGGGELEFQVIKNSLSILKSDSDNIKIIDFPLGPLLGQCCGGYVKVELKKYLNGKTLIKENDLKNSIMKNNINLYIFGAGHVGKAIIDKLEGIGFNVFVIDSRQNYISNIKKNYVEAIYSKDNNTIINHTRNNSFYLIMTHSHKIDLELCALLLKKNDYSFIGLIGSKTKKNKFNKRLLDIGFDQYSINQIECPVGLKNIEGKEPNIIAISIIGRLIEYRSLIFNKNKNNYKNVVNK